MSNSMDSSIQWLERLSSTLDSDPDIIDCMPIEDVRRDLKSLGVDSDKFYSRISKLLEPTFEERLKKKLKMVLKNLMRFYLLFLIFFRNNVHWCLLQ
ncbi:hypothetical protein [Desulfamplus magnetovallimortis]|nr:hypothetical protein [Desulfamplus magnetovallimortis]